MEIDLMGQYYTSINNNKQSGVFALIVHLKESVDPEILQFATNDLMRRLPFLNGRVKKGFFHYNFEKLKTFAPVQPESSEPLFSDYYNYGNRHMIRVTYGSHHFTIKTTHSICDGRGLSKFTSALIVRYYELLGIKVNKGEIIDCNDDFDPEEAEDAVNKYMSNPPKLTPEKEETNKLVYKIEASENMSEHILTECFDAKEIKMRAKKYNLSISEYIMALIFRTMAEQRDKENEGGMISGSVQIDCRRFFPSKTFRSFVTAKNITMPETPNFTEMAAHINKQFKAIDKEYIHANLYNQRKLYQMGRYIPRFIKVHIMRMVSKMEASNSTTGLSNLGMIKLPSEIENRIKYIEFPIAIEQGFSNFFSCATVGNTLTLTATFRDVGREAVENVMRAMKSE